MDPASILKLLEKLPWLAAAFLATYVLGAGFCQMLFGQNLFSLRDMILNHHRREPLPDTTKSLLDVKAFQAAIGAVIIAIIFTIRNWYNVFTESPDLKKLLQDLPMCFILGYLILAVVAIFWFFAVVWFTLQKPRSVF